MSIEIYWKDLTPEKQKEILEKYGSNCDMDLNPLYMEGLSQNNTEENSKIQYYTTLQIYFKFTKQEAKEVADIIIEQEALDVKSVSIQSDICSLYSKFGCRWTGEEIVLNSKTVEEILQELPNTFHTLSSGQIISWKY